MGVKLIWTALSSGTMGINIRLAMKQVGMSKPGVSGAYGEDLLGCEMQKVGQSLEWLHDDWTCETFLAMFL